MHTLFRWSQWASPEEPNEWGEKLVSSKEGLLCFLKAFVQGGSVSGAEDQAARIYRYMSLKNVEALDSPETLEQRVKQLSVDELADEEKAAIRAFQRALKRRKEGKGDDDWGRDTENEEE